MLTEENVNEAKVDNSLAAGRRKGKEEKKEGQPTMVAVGRCTVLVLNAKISKMAEAEQNVNILVFSKNAVFELGKYF